MELEILVISFHPFSVEGNNV